MKEVIEAYSASRKRLQSVARESRNLLDMMTERKEMDGSTHVALFESDGNLTTWCELMKVCIDEDSERMEKCFHRIYRALRIALKDGDMIDVSR